MKRMAELLRNVQGDVPDNEDDYSTNVIEKRGIFWKGIILMYFKFRNVNRLGQATYYQDIPVIFMLLFDTPQF